ncbi:uncharacterized protein LOC144311574 isoform X5 [Canis aureus]
MAPALPELHCGKPPGNHLHHPFPTPSANPRSVPGLPATGRFARLRWSPRIGSALRLRWSPPIGSALHLRWSPCIGSALRLRWSPRIGSALRLRWSPRIGSALHLRWSPRIGSALHLRWSPPIGSALHLRLLRDSRPPRRPAWNTRRGPFSGVPAAVPAASLGSSSALCSRLDLAVTEIGSRGWPAAASPQRVGSPRAGVPAQSGRPEPGVQMHPAAPFPRIFGGKRHRLSEWRCGKRSCLRDTGAPPAEAAQAK